MFRSMSRCALALAVAAVLEFANSGAVHADPPVPPASPTQAADAPVPETVSDPLSAAAAPACACACACEFDWTKVPRVRPFPRIGNFPVLPSGPGYYSVLDQLHGNYLNGPPKYPYPRFGLIQPSFFDVDNFSYLDNPNNTEHDFFDPLKRVRIGENWLFVTGGDVRTRYENLYNARLTQQNDSYDLSRLRVYTDLWYRDNFRLYAEYLGAWSAGQEIPRLPIDENKSGLLNRFAYVKLSDLGGNPADVCVGRQELLFGSQRLISPLDWANTRRTFQGVRAFRQTEKWDFDMFWVQPVIPNPNRFDSVDNNQNFAGAWATYRPKKSQAIDAYYLFLDNTNVAAALDIPRGQFTRHTFGGRYVGNVENFLFDIEAAMQLGSQNGRDVVAGMATAVAGYHFQERRWNPTVWAYYAFASGGGPTSGTAHTFNQLFPFGHITSAGSIWSAGKTSTT